MHQEGEQRELRQDVPEAQGGEQALDRRPALESDPDELVRNIRGEELREDRLHLGLIRKISSQRQRRPTLWPLA